MQLAADFIEGEGFKNALVTVTRCDATPNLGRADIYITVFPEEKEQEILKDLKSKIPALRDFVAHKFKAHSVPAFNIELDFGEKNRQKIDQLLKES